MIEILNKSTRAAVPMIPTAVPDVSFVNVYGERFVFDANSLVVLYVDEAAQGHLRKTTPANLPLLWSRYKPNVPVRTVEMRRLCLNLTHECNLACGYCFSQNEKGHIALRDIRRAWKLLGAGMDIDVAFFGGEPLVAWRELSWAVGDAEREAEKRNVKTKFHVTTNGTLLDADKVAFLDEHGFSMIVSIDGPACAHDAARKRADGTGSHAAAMTGLYHVKQSNLAGRTLLRGTFSTADTDLAARLEYLNDLCDKGYATGVAVEPAIFGALPKDVEALRPVYHEASQWFVRRIRNRQAARFVHYKIMLDRILNTKHAVAECGGSCGYLAVDPDGTLHACHVAGFPIGHLDYGVDEEARAGWCDARLYRRPACMKCEIRYLCGGGCRLHNHATGRPLDDPDPARCAIYRIWFEECLWIAAQLTPEERARAVGK